jgi:RHH-type proline utilization regulon transcriptional repressor/proline dehydrogenase/delta 1-pyrroline-5-carboxylate dehydrogenase
MRLVPDAVALAADGFAAALFEGAAEATREWHEALAARAGPIVTPQCLTTAELAAGADGYVLERLLAEVSISINTAAAGGNASLMTLG